MSGPLRSYSGQASSTRKMNSTQHLTSTPRGEILRYAQNDRTWCPCCSDRHLVDVNVLKRLFQLFQPGDDFNFDPGAGKSQFGDTNRRPCREGVFHVKVFDLHKSSEIFLQVNVEGCHLNDVVE